MSKLLPQIDIDYFDMPYSKWLYQDHNKSFADGIDRDFQQRGVDPEFKTNPKQRMFITLFHCTLTQNHSFKDYLRAQGIDRLTQHDKVASLVAQLWFEQGHDKEVPRGVFEDVLRDHLSFKYQHIRRAFDATCESAAANMA